MKKIEEQTKKNLIKRLIAGSVALFVAVGSLFVLVINIPNIAKKSKNKTNTDTKPRTYTNGKLNDIGTELEFAKANTELVGQDNYGNPLDVSNIVKSETNGKTYINEEAYNKSEDVGKVEIDTKDGKYEVSNDGKVIAQEQGYEIHNEQGKVIEQGNTPIPEGYVEQENGNLLPEGVITLSQNYYDADGNIVYSSGEKIESSAYDKLEDYVKSGYLFKTKPVVSETAKIEDTTSETVVVTPSTEGIVNPNGTYTIYGLTFQTKADYDQWVIQGYEGYNEVNGIMMSDEALLEYQKSIKK